MNRYFLILPFIILLIVSGCATSRYSSYPEKPSQNSPILAELKKFQEMKEKERSGGFESEIPQDPFEEQQPTEEFSKTPSDYSDVGETRDYVPPADQTGPGEVKYDPWADARGSVYERVSGLEDYVRAVGARIVRVNFPMGSSKPSSSGLTTLEGLAGMADRYRVRMLTGYSSRGKNQKRDKELSFARTETVGDKLHQMGFDLSRTKLNYGGPTSKFGKSAGDNQVVVVVLQEK